MKEKTAINGRAILALIGACIFQFAVLGTFINSHGVYMAKIKETAQLSMTAISATTSIRSIAGALLASYLTMLFYKKNQCAVMFFSLLSVCASYVLTIFVTDNFLWYVVPVLCAPVSSITILAVPHVLMQWFPKKSGTAAGIAMASSGLGGAVCNPLAASLCESVGWQWTIVIIAVLSMVLGCIGLYLMFILKGEPEKAEEPAEKSGNPAGHVEGIHAPAALRFVLCSCSILLALASVMAANLSIHMQNLGFSLAIGASVTSALMIGNIGGKVIFGWVSDKIGIWRSVMVVAVLVGIGLLILGFNKSSVGLMYAGGLSMGMCYFIGTIGISKCSLAAYGTEEMKKFSGYHAGINSALSATLAFIVGPIFDKVGSFTPMFVFLAGLCAVSFVSALVMFILGKRKTGTLK